MIRALARLTSRRPSSGGDAELDERPGLAVGHVPLLGRDIGVLADFYASIGMRRVARLPGVAILELRGGTHLAISKGDPSTATLDLMVDDLDAAHHLLAEVGAEPSPIRRSFPHRVFNAADPEGNQLLIHSSHVTGVV